MNISEEEKREIEAQTKKRLGFKVNLDGFKITTEQVENGIMSLLESERKKRGCAYHAIFVKAFLIEEKKILSTKMEQKFRLKTFWFSKDGKLNADAKDRKLISYTTMDVGGMISKIFKSMIQEMASSDPETFPSPLDINIVFQFNVEVDDVKLEVNFVKDGNPINVYQKVDFKTIFG